jgi:hypothetical protein
MAVNINVPSQVKTYANLAAFPASGALKTIYIAEDTNKTYRWTGSVYVEVSAAGASGITIGTTAITSGTVGRVLFEGTGNVVQESANLFWDNTNGFLGIGTSTPSTKLHVVGSEITFAVASGTMNFYNTPGANSHFNFINSRQDSDYIFKQNRNGVANSTSLVLKGLTGNVLINTTTDAGFRLDVNGTARVQGNAQFGTGFYWDNTNGRLGIGTSSPIQPLTINGRALIGTVTNIGSGTGLTALQVSAIGTSPIQILSDSTKVFGLTYEYNSAATSFYIFSDYYSGAVEPKLTFGTYTNRTNQLVLNKTGNIGIGTTTDAGFKLDVNGTARVQGQLSVTSNIVVGSTAGVTAPFFNGATNPFQFGVSSIYLTHTNSVAVASGLRSAFLDTIGWQQSSGTAEFASFRATPTYNTTGTYSGIVRGFHYKPTITSLTGATHYAIHTEAGRVRFENLPTSATGLSAGDIWNDSGTLKIV